jgi:hypothetical protein
MAKVKMSTLSAEWPKIFREAVMNGTMQLGTFSPAPENPLPILGYLSLFPLIMDPEGSGWQSPGALGTALSPKAKEAIETFLLSIGVPAHMAAPSGSKSEIGTAAKASPAVAESASKAEQFAKRQCGCGKDGKELEKRQCGCGGDDQLEKRQCGCGGDDQLTKRQCDCGKDD